MRAINLVPADDRQGQFNGGKSGGAVYGVLVALFILVLGAYVFSTSKAKETKAKNELATVQQSTDAYTQVATQYSSFQTASQAAEQRIATVQSLAKARFDWAGSLRDLARLVPKDVRIGQLGASVSTDAASTGGGSAFRSAIASPAINFTGCSYTQNTVANLVTSLQAMRRVTNVTLEYSKQAADAGSGGDGTTCQFYGFAIDVFFAAGNAVSAANATPSTSTGGTLATETTTGTPVAATTPAAGAAATTPAAGAATTTPTAGN